ncbi:putative uncharacterized protein DDB_G0271606 [Anopheles cruzii]|uniref:putative uncharacterized protein DDB_G0271606 n=1 Tax=Anopheles cruzii TaxID=68878 RepID=UPI0022EC7825|nr:putative uncharacterized protein DDB_G0271606 [Anopheles cruzii]
MLYLEDYLEMIEHLPQELRDRFTEMREMDLSVQNNTDALDKRARALFQQCRRGDLPSAAAETEYAAIRTDYYRVLEDSDEKIQLAGQTYDLVERYLRRLDSELHKFKCELEADHNGITEILEKRSLELDTTTSNGSTNQKENRFYDAHNSFSTTHNARSDTRYKTKSEKRRDSIAPAAVAALEKRSLNISAPSSNVSVPSTPTSLVGASHQVINSSPAAAVAYNLQTFGAGNAIAAAASQAIAQTQQMQQGRRTASLKASYEAIGGAGSHELLINSELAGATHNALQAVEREANAFSSQRRQKKKNLANKNLSPSLPTAGLQVQQPVLSQQSTTVTQSPVALQQPQPALQLSQPVLLQPQLVQHQQHQIQSTITSTVPSPVVSTVQPQLHHVKAPIAHMQIAHTGHLQQLAIQQQQAQKQQPLTQPQLQQQSQQLVQQQLKHSSQLQAQPQAQQQAQSHPVSQQLSQQQLQHSQKQQLHQTTLQLQQSPLQLHQPQLQQHIHQQLQQQLQQLQHKKQPLLKQQASLLPQQQPRQLLQQPSQHQPQQQSHLHIQLSQQQQHIKQKQHKLPQQQQQQPLPVPQTSLIQSHQQQQQVPQVLHHLQQQHQLQQYQMQSITHQQHRPMSQQQQQFMDMNSKELMHLQQTLQHVQPVPLAQPAQTQTQVKQQEQQQQQTQLQPQPQIQSQQQILLQQQLQQQTQQQLHQQPPQSQQQPQQQLQAQLQQQQSQLQPQQQLPQQLPLASMSTQQQIPQLQQAHLMQPSLFAPKQQIPNQIGQLSQHQLSHHQQLGQASILQPQQSLCALTTVSTIDTPDSTSATTIDGGGTVAEQSENDWSFDPNEPRYCVCNQVSYGDMVACDNDGCPFEWFHYPCVNITSSPKGRWYCPQCSSSMKRRASRKN